MDGYVKKKTLIVRLSHSDNFFSCAFCLEVFTLFFREVRAENCAIVPRVILIFYTIFFLYSSNYLKWKAEN